MSLDLPCLADAVALDPAAVNLLRQDQRRIVIVGAGGWIGRTLLAGLTEALGVQTVRSRVACFGSSEREVEFGEGRTVTQKPLAEIALLDRQPTIVFHLAFLTKDKVGSMSVDEYVGRNRAVSDTVHQSLDVIGADRIFVASSGAAAFADDEAAADDLRLYGALKLADEQLFAKWASANARKAAIVRIFSVSGPFINKHDTYALASFINDALAGRPVEVRAPMRVVRSYVPVREVLSLAIAQLLAPGENEVVRYDSGGTPYELGDVAKVVAATLGGEASRASITVDRENAYFGDAVQYRKLLAKFGIQEIALDRQIADTAVTMARLP